MTGVSPEGLAISPNGRYVVTTNLERSYLPYNDDRITWFSSLTLIMLDPQTGQLNRVADYPFDGILPEAAAFDASSQYLAVVNYDFFDDRTPGGSIDFWRIASDPLNPQPMLVQTRYSVPVTRGAHSMVLVP
jgi:DNA-binding beta-propeller fold protein YncE